jgi:RimJ/RimL family protein N-acetyltransferase
MAPSSDPLPELLEGPRIVLRRWRLEDCEAMGRAVAESAEHLRPWMPWMLREPLSNEQRREMVSRTERAWRDGGDVMLGVFLDGRAIGSVGMHRRIGPDGLELGYWIHPGFARRGYATEAARLMTDAALAVPGISHVEIHHDKANVASGGVPRKLGFELIEERPNAVAAPGEVGVDLVWRMTRERWERSDSIRP